MHDYRHAKKPAAAARTDGARSKDVFQVSLVLPVREEAVRLGKVLTRLGRFLRAVGWSAELIVVDDGSEDGSGEAAARWKSYFETFSVVRHARAKGRGVAARTGMLLARGRSIVLVDPRGETPIEDATLLVECLEQGADVAIASRKVPGAEVALTRGFLDRASETTFTALSRIMVPLGVRDSSADLRAFRRGAGRHLAQRARVAGDAYGYEWLALASRLGLQVVEVPVTWVDEASAKGRLRPNELVMLRDLWRLRRRLGKEEAPRPAPAHDLLHETGFVRLDRRALLGRRARA